MPLTDTEWERVRRTGVKGPPPDRFPFPIPHVVDAYCPHLGAHLGVGSGEPESHEPGAGTVHGK